MAVTNCAFAGNSAATGGAIENLGTLFVVNSTFWQNAAANEGSGIDAQGGAVHAYNSIFWQNTQAAFGTLETSQIFGAAGVTPDLSHSPDPGAQPVCRQREFVL